MTKEKGSYITVDGLKTFYVKAGHGPSVLLVHGGSPGASALVNRKIVRQILAPTAVRAGGFQLSRKSLREPRKRPAVALQDLSPNRFRMREQG